MIDVLYHQNLTNQQNFSKFLNSSNDILPQCGNNITINFKLS